MTFVDELKNAVTPRAALLVIGVLGLQLLFIVLRRGAAQAEADGCRLRGGGPAADVPAGQPAWRGTYVALNSGARRYRFRMMEDLYAIRSGTAPDPATSEVARVEFQDTYAKAQMLVPDERPGSVRRCQAIRVATGRRQKASWIRWPGTPGTISRSGRRPIRS
ncbi:hypothetical protein SMICM304S_01152 [Streptomyces microflavus]